MKLQVALGKYFCVDAGCTHLNPHNTTKHIFIENPIREIRVPLSRKNRPFRFVNKPQNQKIKS